MAEARRRYDALPHGGKRVLADALGLSPDQLSKIMSGERKLDALEAIALARRLGMRPPEQMVGKDLATILEAVSELEDAGVPPEVRSAAAADVSERLRSLAASWRGLSADRKDLP